MGLWIPYLVVGVVLLIIGGFHLIDANFADRKNAARVILIAPVWPLLAPLFLFKGFRWLWKRADWKGVEEEEHEHRRSQRGYR